ncbi:MAG: DCC1-like thiol-disulfide oxidoreductase family protein [Pseudomonadota bacterium]
MPTTVLETVRPQEEAYVADIIPEHVQALVVFDNVCVLCSGFVRFVSRFDRDQKFHLTSAQGELGQKLYRRLGLPLDDFQTNLVIVDGTVHQKMNAFATAMRVLGFPWSILSVVDWLPKFVSDPLYDLIAKNRYHIFGRYEECPVPPRSVRDRML